MLTKSMLSQMDTWTDNPKTTYWGKHDKKRHSLCMYIFPDNIYIYIHNLFQIQFWYFPFVTGSDQIRSFFLWCLIHRFSLMSACVISSWFSFFSFSYLCRNYYNRQLLRLHLNKVMIDSSHLFLSESVIFGSGTVPSEVSPWKIAQPNIHQTTDRQR